MFSIKISLDKEERIITKLEERIGARSDKETFSIYTNSLYPITLQFHKGCPRKKYVQCTGCCKTYSLKGLYAEFQVTLQT